MGVFEQLPSIAVRWTGLPLERLQKVMAHAGVASRRKCEEFIREGRVTVNGEVAELGCKVDPEKDQIEVDGEPVGDKEKLVYIMLNKPEGYISTVSDPRGRQTVMDLVASVDERIYPVGRLDYDSSGLLLLTNDGELTHRLLHPRYESDKTYTVTVAGSVSRQVLEQIRRGVELEDGPTAPAEVTSVHRRGNRTRFRLVIHEGRNRQIRRMMKRLGHQVIELRRVLGDLPPGSYRELTRREIRALRQYAGL